MPSAPGTRRWSRAIGAAALAPAVAHAQFGPVPGSPTYTYVGCSPLLPAAFGAGSRVCATVVLTVGPESIDPANPPTEWIGAMTVHATFPAPYRWADCGNTNCGPVMVGGAVPGNGINDDVFHAPDCNLFWACAAGTTSYGTFPFRFGPPGLIPSSSGSFAAYIFDPAQVAPGDVVWDLAFDRPAPGLDVYLARFTLTSIPEPSAVALLAGGLFALAGVTRRRRV